MLEALSTIWAASFTDVVSLTAFAAIAVLAVLTAVALRRSAVIGGVLGAPRTGVHFAIRRAHPITKHSDPDAAGRARPRAPTTNLAA